MRKTFTGQPEHVINYLFMVAEEVREIMAGLGYRTFNEMVGQTQMLDQNALVAHWKARGWISQSLFFRQKELPGQKIYHSEGQNHHLEAVLDRTFDQEAQASIDPAGAPVNIEMEINNTDRSAGAMLSGTLAKLYGDAGLPHDTIQVSFKGTAGQAFGAWLCAASPSISKAKATTMSARACPAAASSCARRAIPASCRRIDHCRQHRDVRRDRGRVYLRGIAGERFAVRNSGAVAVVEGAGDHRGEYMTGGIVVVLGKTGRNSAAGMSGGVAYVLDEDGGFPKLCNLAMVELEPVLSEEMIDQNTYHHTGDLEADGRVDVFANLLGADVERLHILISRRMPSWPTRPRARAILADWKNDLPKFRKVMPVEYRRALKELKANADAEPKIAIGA